MEVKLNPAQQRFRCPDEYVKSLRDEVVAETGIKSDGYHAGKLMYHVLNKHPHVVNQIEGLSGQRETNESVLKRSVQLATAMRRFGLKVGDVITVMGPHHMDLCLPVFAGHFIGAPVMPWSIILSTDDLELDITRSHPKLVFVQSEFISRLESLQQKYHFEIVTFDKNEHYDSLQEFIEKYSTGESVTGFRVSDLDPYESVAWILRTSGTTGTAKLVMLTHSNIVHQQAPLWQGRPSNELIPPGTSLYFVTAPLQLLTAMMMYVAGVICVCPRVQVATTLTVDIMIDVINKYRPTYAIVGPPITLKILASSTQCDLSCFTTLVIGGSAVPNALFTEVKKFAGQAVACGMGMTELCGMVFRLNRNPENGAVGKPTNLLQYKLVDLSKGTEVGIGEMGELWVKGPGVFKGYMNEPEKTIEAFSDGWFKTGDLLYKDAEDYFYYVDRASLLIKYMDYKISPVEVEMVIRQLKGVHDVVVTSVSSSGAQLPAAVVTPKEGYQITAEQIKQHVQDNLPDHMQLRGGVFFLDNIPLTQNTLKPDRVAIKQWIADKLTS